MPECLECGTVLPRLQWTHFRYKCTGKFKNGTEYVKHYPNAKLVDDDLAKKTAVTLENLTAKYGEEEALIRWETYKSKQAHTNSFEYKEEKYGWSREEYDIYNKSRAVTMENLIKKHGFEMAHEVYSNYIESQSYTCSEEYFIKEYGENEGRRKYANFIKNRASSYWVNRDKNTPKRSSRLEDRVYDELKVILSSDLENQIIIADSKKGPYDFGCHENKKVIEFYGTYWHGDVRVYDSNIIHPTSKKYIYEIHEHDANKRKVATEMGYDVYVIWELDWKQNKDEVLNDITRWWNGN